MLRCSTCVSVRATLTLRVFLCVLRVVTLPVCVCVCVCVCLSGLDLISHKKLGMSEESDISCEVLESSCPSKADVSTHAHTHTRTHTRTHTHSHALKHTHRHTHTDAHTSRRTHTHTHTDARTHAHTHTHTHTQRRTHTHTDAHTQTHTHAQSLQYICRSYRSNISYMYLFIYLFFPTNDFLSIT